MPPGRLSEATTLRYLDACLRARLGEIHEAQLVLREPSRPRRRPPGDAGDDVPLDLEEVAWLEAVSAGNATSPVVQQALAATA